MLTFDAIESVSFPCCNNKDDIKIWDLDDEYSRIFDEPKNNSATHNNTQGNLNSNGTVNSCFRFGIIGISQTESGRKENLNL